MAAQGGPREEAAEDTAEAGAEATAAAGDEATAAEDTAEAGAEATAAAGDEATTVVEEATREIKEGSTRDTNHSRLPRGAEVVGTIRAWKPAMTR